MGLIVLMFVLQTVHSACNWYPTWLGFIYYSNAPDQALDALAVDPLMNLTLQVTGSMNDLLSTLRLAIADSIMVSNHPLFLVKITNSSHLQGLEVLDHMQQQLESSNCSSGLQSCVNRYVMALGEKVAELFQPLG